MPQSDLGKVVSLIGGYLQNQSEPIAINVLTILCHSSGNTLTTFLKTTFEAEHINIVQGHVKRLIEIMTPFDFTLHPTALHICLYRRVKNLSSVLALELS